MSISIDSILDGVVSYAMASGWFERVNSHEPKNAPSNGLSAAVWLQQIDPVPAASGLNTTSARLVFNLRIYQNFLSEPQDAIDPNLMKAADALMAAYSGDFDLGGTVRNVDLLGQFDFALSAKAGYLSQDGKLFRVFDLTIPLVVNDLWTQVA